MNSLTIYSERSYIVLKYSTLDRLAIKPSLKERIIESFYLKTFFHHRRIIAFSCRSLLHSMPFMFDTSSKMKKEGVIIKSWLLMMRQINSKKSEELWMCCRSWAWYGKWIPERGTIMIDYMNRLFHRNLLSRGDEDNDGYLY